MHRQAPPPGTSVHASDRTTSTQDCRPVRSQGELATKERPQAVLYPQPQWWQKSGGPLPILAKAEAQAEAIGTHPRHGSNGGKKQWQEAMAGITIKFSCGICIELKLNNWIGAVATATATAAIAATATMAPTTAMHSQRYNAAMRSAEHRHP